MQGRLMGSIIKEQLGESWDRLNPNIRERFSRDPGPGEVINYTGIMHVIRRSLPGCLFAYLTYVIGKPLTPFAEQEITMNVNLTSENGGVCWQRIYYRNNKEFIVRSIKKAGRRGEMMECVGGGFGMLLRVFEEDAALHFESYRFFWQLFGLRIQSRIC